jgi:hypothetical protein
MALPPKVTGNVEMGSSPKAEEAAAPRAMA